MFQKQQMENLVKDIQENSNIYEIKTGVKNFNLFPKKLIKTKLINTLSIPKSDDYNINVDVENNMIVLQDKKLEDNLIVFAELTHNGSQSVNFYNSLMNTVKPILVFLEQEPFEIYQETNSMDNTSDSKIKFIEYKDKFSHIQEFRNYLKDNKSDRNYILKSSDYIYNEKKEIMEIESIIYNALNKNIKINLFDLNHQEYLNTLLHKNEDDNNYYKKNFFNLENKKVISILNNLEISAWINLQTIKGCKNCTSFLTRNEIDWNPLSLEFVVNKKNLPNYKEALYLKSKKIFDKISEKKDQKYIIFSTESLNLVKNYIEFSNKNSKIRENADLFFNNFKRKFIREFSLNFENSTNKENKLEDNEEINLDDYFDILSCSLIMKEKFHVYSKHPPFKIKKSEQSDFIKMYKQNFTKNFDIFFNLESTDISEFDNEDKNELILDKNEKTMLKFNDCSPYIFYQNLKNIRENMLQFK